MLISSVYKHDLITLTSLCRWGYFQVCLSRPEGEIVSCAELYPVIRNNCSPHRVFKHNPYLRCTHVLQTVRVSRGSSERGDQKERTKPRISRFVARRYLLLDGNFARAHWFGLTAARQLVFVLTPSAVYNRPRKSECSTCSVSLRRLNVLFTWLQRVQDVDLQDPPFRSDGSEMQPHSRLRLEVGWLPGRAILPQGDVGCGGGRVEVRGGWVDVKLVSMFGRAYP